MNFSEIIQRINSTRDFRNELVDDVTLEKIRRDAINSINENMVDIIVYKNGDEIFGKLNGKAGYFGNVIKAPIYMVFLSDDIKSLAYATEISRFSAFDSEVGSCWISAQNGKVIIETLDINLGKKYVSILALGYPYDGFFKQDIQQQSARNAATEIVFIEKWGNTPSWEELEERGLGKLFYYTRFAPSNQNKQLWKFLDLGNKILLFMKKDDNEFEIALNGEIASFYFETACQIEGYKIKTIEFENSDYENLCITGDYVLLKTFDLSN